MRFWIFTILFLTFGALPAWADLAISTDTIRFEPETGIVGRSVKIYFSVFNFSDRDRRGIVKFYDETEGQFLGPDQSVSVIAHEKDTIFLDFVPNISGEHAIAVRVDPWETEGEISDNNKITKTFFVDEDTDDDGIGNQEDEDDDGDGVPDTEDTFPLDGSEWADTEGDGIGNNADEDDDNDGVPDVADAFPLDASETEDIDQDGIGGNADEDDDGDGLNDDAEGIIGTDSRVYDTDGDRVGDGEDDFPLDPSQTFDTDKDGIPDEQDRDDDGDGVADSEDAFPKDVLEIKDTDGDGVGDNADQDDDNDGLFDLEEIEANTDPLKADSDNDGFADGEDDLPLDATEHQDSDHDGVGDGSDVDSSNPGPAVEVKVSAERTRKGNIVTFDASGSYDPDGAPLQFQWEFPDGSVRSEARVDYAFHKSGNRTVLLTVTDSAGESRTKKLQVYVEWEQWERYLWFFILVLVVISFFGPRKKKEASMKNEGGEGQ